MNVNLVNARLCSFYYWIILRNKVYWKEDHAKRYSLDVIMMVGGGGSHARCVPISGLYSPRGTLIHPAAEH